MASPNLFVWTNPFFRQKIGKLRSAPFPWHYEGICSGNGSEEGPDDPAKTMVENIFRVMGRGDYEDKMQIGPVHLPNPAFYFQLRDIVVLRIPGI
jgi:hypothetical protein